MILSEQDLLYNNKKIQAHPLRPVSSVQSDDQIEGSANNRHGILQHELSTIMEREQLTNSQRRSSGQHFFPPLSNNQQLGFSSDMINPDEENYIVKKSIVVQRPHPLTTTNKLVAARMLQIPTTPTSVSHQIVSKERQQLDQERREYEDRKNQLEGLYQQLHKELEDIQLLKQAYTQIGTVSQATAGQLGIHLMGGSTPSQYIAPNAPQTISNMSYEDSRIDEATNTVKEFISEVV